MSTRVLFTPHAAGDLALPNRLVLSPMTRSRALPGGLANPLAATYYAQRASAGLLISEGTQVSPQGVGYIRTPGIHSAAQAAAWAVVTEAVHAAGGRIVAQLWHMGRLVHSVFNDGKQPVSASATKGEGRAHTPVGRRDLEEARPLRLDEIPRVIGDYVKAAENAKKAGFDGVQLHGANGYLIDQFLRDNSNLRDDDYGGPVENRIRLLREVTEALIGVWGKDRVAVRLSPNGETQGVDDSAPEKLFPAAVAALDALGIAFLELREPGPEGTFGRTDVPKQSPAIRQAFKGPLILNSDYTAALAEEALASGIADAIAFGRPFIGNPDLVERIRTGAEWAVDNPQTWYSPGPEGYTDYPALVAA